MGLAQSRTAASTDVSTQSTGGNPVLSSNQDQLEQAGELDAETLEAAGARVAELLEEYLSLQVNAPAAYLPEVDEAEPEVDPSAGTNATQGSGTDDQSTDDTPEIVLPDPIPVTFQSPYWTDRWGAADSDFPTVREGVTAALLDGQPAGRGRGSPEEMETVVQAGLDSREIAPPPPLPGPDSPMTAGEWEGIIESWMQTNGVGIDCSGFVTQALTELGVETNFIGTLTGIGPDQYYNVLQGYDVDPMDIQPLDIMYLGPPTDDSAAEPRHVRIVISAETVDGGREFITAESSWTPRAGEDPSAAILAGRGPREHQWRYADGQLYERAPGSTAWTESAEDPAYMRILDDGRANLPSEDTPPAE